MSLSRQVTGTLLGLALLAAAPLSSACAQDLIDLRFPGGTARDYVSAIRAKGDLVNIVLMPEAADVRVPPVELRSVSIADALELLDEVSDRRPNQVAVQLAVSARGRDGDGSAIYTVTSNAGRGQASGTMVLSVAPILEGGVEPEALLTAIETALELVAEEYEPAQIRFHEATGLIIARGHPEQLRLIRELVGQVHETVAFHVNRNEADATMQEVIGELNELRRQRSGERAQREAMANELREQERMRIQFEEMASDLRAQLVRRTTELEEVTRELARLRAELDAREKPE